MAWPWRCNNFLTIAKWQMDVNYFFLYTEALLALRGASPSLYLTRYGAVSGLYLMPILHARELSLATSCAQDTTAIELCSSLTTHRAYRHSPTSLTMPKSKQKRTTSRPATKGPRRSARASTRASTRSTVLFCFLNIYTY